AYLSAITWPDIPEMYKGLYGWMGDTIPSFNRSSYDYKVVLPAGVDKLPALVAKNEDDNARVEVTRAISLTGNAAQRTTTFTSYAENDTTILTYKVLMEKKKDPQPWAGEPFFSQIIWQEQWANAFMEIVNPGTAAIDLSNYMLFFGYNDNPASAIGSLSAAGDYNNRYGKYIPGYKWQTQAEWEVKPAIAVQDLNVNPIVQSGDVFVIGDIRSTGTSYGYYGAGNWPAENACDIDFGHNPWGETVNNWTALQQWNGVHYYLFKIVGDSIKEGLKPATDPNDFELIDTWGGVGTGQPTIGGLLLQQINGYVRKPQYYSGKTGLGESWGTDAATSEWVMTDRAYYNSIGVYWPADILRVADGLGSHFMYDVTVGKSTVASVLYKVSEGYTMDETILGAATGVTVEDFLANIYKEQENQTLIVKHDGTEITGTTVLANGDSLLVISADGSNMSRYFIEVTDGGSLSKDAVLTSTTYTVNVTGATGTVSNFDYGTTLKAVVAGVTVPAGANMTVVDENDAYIALTKLSFDTTYVDVLASDKMYFEVVAEDGATKILYQLVPNATSSDAFVISDVFTVDQETSLISSVPRGITVPAFLSNLTPATGASMVLKDKADYDRNEGVVVLDDKLVVTSQDGTTTKLYYLELQDVTGWLAYVLSSVYDVNQSGMLISGEGINNTITVSTFTGNLTPAAAATMEVQDALGAAKTSTQKLVENDVLQVTSGNGLNVVYYDIDVIMISVKDHMGNGISVYPNPTSGLVNVAGLEAGNHIKVYNSVGVLVNEYVAGSSVEEISMSNERSGLYFIIVSDDNNVKGTYKVILQ
ncbi:MAG: T9SS type A sorting domain-containing protein, partial [Bacteroidota bacterium]